jgi:PhoPQ-activated pathogenicity-related protein
MKAVSFRSARSLACGLVALAPFVSAATYVHAQATADGGATAVVEKIVDPVPTLELPAHTQPTALDRYVAAADDTYAWKLVNQKSLPGGTLFVLELTSQTWLTPDEVDRPVWKHWLNIIKPDQVRSETGMMFIAGGGNGGSPPEKADERVLAIAKGTGTVVCELKMVPNQPLVFHGDGQPRVEDDLIAYTWSQYIETGDDRWPARQPMVKSVVRAMDASQEFLASEAGGKAAVKDFVVAGGSKRGWTTWMTAAVDKRVVAIAPLVIDVLNLDRSMRHHFAAYGFWAPAVSEYVDHEIMQRREHPRFAELMMIEDPFAYRNRFTMPKCIINASGDQFFLPDSSQFYFDDLPGEKHLCYVPNADHGLGGSNALDTLIAFHFTVAHGIDRPELKWEFVGGDSISIAPQGKVSKVLLWEATNPEARDFRVESFGKHWVSREIKLDANNQALVRLDVPSEGWKASFIQCEFDVGAPVPLRTTTGVRVLPDTLPYLSLPIPTLASEVKPEE